MLEQSCQSLVTAGDMTAAQCTEVHEVGLATELRTTPPALPQPPDAPATCPAGTTKSLLFDSETGANPTSKLVSDSGTGSWIRDEYSYLGSNATSGLDSWFGINPDPDFGDEQTNSLVAANGISIPAGQKTYLWFQGWYLFEYGSSAAANYDGGAVEVDDLGNAAAPVDVANLPWVNGPSKVLASGNPAAGRKAFARDSNGWVASRLDLSAFAGKNVKPQFTTYGDTLGSYIGWWLDDIRVYTCTPPAPAPSVIAGSVTVKGQTVVGKKLKAKVAGWSPAGVTFSYQWLRNGKVIKNATAKKYKLTNKDKGKKLRVRVTASKAGYTSATAVSKKTKKVTDE